MSNQEWLERSRKVVWHPCTQMKVHETLPLVPIARGSGVWLEDFDGRRYFDGVSSWWVNLFGHGHPRITAALKEQLDELEHVILAGFTHRPVIELSERLTALTGLAHCMYGSDGASATEMALKMSFHYWRNAGRPGKTRFVAVRNGYHGETLGALSVTDVALFKDVYAPLVRESLVVPSPDWRLAAPGEDAQAYALRCAAALEDLLAREHESIAAFIVEPLVQGAAGMAMHHPAYLREARRLCDRYGVHLIADEIAVGFGRSGTLFAHEQAAIRPDLLCLSKGITGGYLPLACVLASDEIYRVFYADEVGRGFLHSHSYTGNALACRAALAVLDLFESEDVLERNREHAREMSELFAPVRGHARVRDWRNCGMIWAFEDGAGKGGRWWFERALARGLLLRPMGDTVYLMPPYVWSRADREWLAQTFLDLLAQD